MYFFFHVTCGKQARYTQHRVHSFHTTKPTFYLRNVNTMVSSRLWKPIRYHCIDVPEIKSRLYSVKRMHPKFRKHLQSFLFHISSQGELNTVRNYVRIRSNFQSALSCLSHCPCCKDWFPLGWHWMKATSHDTWWQFHPMESLFSSNGNQPQPY